MFCVFFYGANLCICITSVNFLLTIYLFHRIDIIIIIIEMYGFLFFSKNIFIQKHSILFTSISHLFAIYIFLSSSLEKKKTRL